MQWEIRKTLLLCYADIVYGKICSSHIFPTKHKTYLLKTSLIMRPEERKPLGELPATTKLLLFVCTFVAFNVTPLQWHWGRGKIFLFIKVRRNYFSSAMTLNPDWSQLTFIPKITPDDTPGGFSMQLMIEIMIEYSLYSRSWLYGYGRTARVCTLGTVRRQWVILYSCSQQPAMLSDQNIKKNLCDCPVTSVDWRITCQLPLSPLISELDTSILLDKKSYSSWTMPLQRRPKWFASLAH